MKDNKPSINLPEGYMKKRKSASLLFIFAIYAYCLILLSKNFGVLDFLSKASQGLFSSVIFIGSIIALIHDFHCKRVYQKVDMINYREFSTFTKIEKSLYAIPILASAYFVPFQLMIYFVVLGFIYAAISKGRRPYGTYHNPGF